MPKAIIKHTEEKRPTLKYVQLSLIVVTPNLKSSLSPDFLYSLWKERDTSKHNSCDRWAEFPSPKGCLLWLSTQRCRIPLHLFRLDIEFLDR